CLFSGFIAIMSQGFTTTILHSDRQSPIEHGALHKPAHLAVAYGFDNAQDLVDVFQGRNPSYAYSRQGSPTATALEAKLTKMEDGIGTITFSSGTAALTAVFTTSLKAGDPLISSGLSFRNTSRLLAPLET